MADKPVLIARIQPIEDRFEELNRLMAEPEMATDLARLQELAKEQASLQELVSLFRAFKATQKELEEAEQLMTESAEPELREMAKEELAELQERLEAQNEALKRMLLPRDRRDSRDVIVEIRAGAGGDEAGLFAADLFRMYSRYAESKRWQTEVLSSNESGIGGFKEIIFEVKGKGAYSRLKYESGVHRVQRVPTTEASGRIHTSTATVAVLAEVDEVEIKIPESDVKMDVYRSSGAGGQNVQKNSTAVRLTHLPTGMVVQCQDERSQLQNRLRAMAILRARLYEMEEAKRRSEIEQTRKLQVGSAERSEKIRTYNFPQSRVTDHRIGFSSHNLPVFLDGGIDELLDELATQDEAERLATVQA